MSDREAAPYHALSTLVSPVDVKITVRKDPTRPYVGLENIPSRGAHLVGWSLASSSISTNSVFQAGDILFGKLRPNLRKCVIAPFDGYCSTDILVLRPNIGVDPSFAGKVLRMERVGGAAEMTAVGTKMPRTSWKHLSELKVFCPAHPEQSKIAHALDTLDTAIHETEAIIAKLKAVKQGLLHDLLTRGIDANGELRPTQAEAPELYKESAVGWIPKEWEVRNLSDCASIASGVTLGRCLTGHESVELPYLRVANVQDGYVDLNEVKRVRVLKSEVDRFALADGDVLMNEGGDYDKLGRGTVWRAQIQPCLHQNHVFRVRSFRNILAPDYLAAYSESYRGKLFFILSAKQSTNLASINSTQLKGFPIPCPRLEEQEAIIEKLNLACVRTAAEELNLDKLHALKSGLMDDLLTGRVRVTPLLEGAAP